MISLQPPVSNSIVFNTNQPDSQGFTKKTSTAIQTDTTDDSTKDNSETEVMDDVPHVHTDDDESDITPLYFD